MTKRSLHAIILNRLSQFPAVVLLGPRHVGKTTLAKSIGQEFNSIYLDLQDPKDKRKLADPGKYLENHIDQLVILDEVHREPGLFHVLRGLIDQGRQKGIRTGRFLVIGSASHSLLNQSGESLAGRVCYVELSPINILEVESPEIDNLWLKGGFPASFVSDSDEQSMNWRENFIRTYLERDIPDIGPRIPAETLYRFWTMLAHSQGNVLNAAQLANSLSVSGKTVARYLDLMVDLLLVRRLQPFHANVGKRLVKSSKIYLRDSGIVHALLEIPNRDALFRHPIYGASWKGFVINNLLANTSNRTLPSFYRTSGGAEIDLILEFPGLSEKWAIEIKVGSTAKPTRGFYNALTDVEPDKSFVVYADEERFQLSEGVEAIGVLGLAILLAEKSRNR